MTPQPSGANAAATASILLRAGLTNRGWTIHTRPDDDATFEIRGRRITKIHAQPIPGHGSWWWYCERLPIAPIGDTDRAAERINRQLGPAGSPR